MTPTEMVEHLRAIAEEFISQAETFEFQAEQYYERRKDAKVKECLKEAKDCRQSAKDARVLAQNFCDKEKKVISELEQLQELIINRDYSKEACESLKILINKFLLATKEPYSTHLRTCGEFYELT
jgi:hypothetical protein